MKIIIKESQIGNLVLKFIGELEKSEDGDKTIWKNEEGTPIFSFSSIDNTFYISRDIFSKIQKLFSLSIGDIWNIAHEFSLKLTGVASEKINLF